MIHNGGWIGYCLIDNCDNDAEIPIGLVENEIYDALTVYFVFYTTTDCYDGGFTVGGNNILKTAVIDFIDDNFPFVDGYIPDEPLEETVYFV